MEKSMVLYKKLCIWYGKNDGTTVTCIPKTMELWFAAKKSMVLFRKLWNFDLLWKKHYGALQKIMENWFTMEKAMLLYQNLRFDL